MCTSIADHVQLVILRENIYDANFYIYTDTKPGDGYLGIHTFVDITGKNKTLSVFVKTASTDEGLRKVCPIRKAFLNETHFYQTIFPAFVEFQEQQGVKTPFDAVAKCYCASSENNKEVLVLENVKLKGYDLWDRQMLMDKNHIVYILREYSRFHALSFALKFHNRRLYEEISNQIYDIQELYLSKEDFQDTFNYLVKEAKTFLDPVHDKNVAETFDRFSEEIFPFLASVAKDSYEFSVINHGDGWCNNFMIKYKDAQLATPSDICFLDWQLMKLGSPVLDISFFFYSSCGKEDMDNLDYYLKIYYDSLSGFLKELNCDPDEIFPLPVFNEHWKKYSRYGLINSLLVIKIMLTEPDEVKTRNDVKSDCVSMADSFNFKIKNEHIYKSRLRDVIVHFIERDLLK